MTLNDLLSSCLVSFEQIIVTKLLIPQTELAMRGSNGIAKGLERSAGTRRSF